MGHGWDIREMCMGGIWVGCGRDVGGTRVGHGSFELGLTTHYKEDGRATAHDWDDFILRIGDGPLLGQKRSRIRG